MEESKIEAQAGLVTLEQYREYYRYTKVDIHRLHERVRELESALREAIPYITPDAMKSRAKSALKA